MTSYKLQFILSGDTIIYEVRAYGSPLDGRRLELRTHVTDYMRETYAVKGDDFERQYTDVIGYLRWEMYAHKEAPPVELAHILNAKHKDEWERCRAKYPEFTPEVYEPLVKGVAWFNMDTGQWVKTDL